MANTSRFKFEVYECFLKFSSCEYKSDTNIKAKAILGQVQIIQTEYSTRL